MFTHTSMHTHAYIHTQACMQAQTHMHEHTHTIAIKFKNMCSYFYFAANVYKILILFYVVIVMPFNIYKISYVCILFFKSYVTGEATPNYYYLLKSNIFVCEKNIFKL